MGSPTWAFNLNSAKSFLIRASNALCSFRRQHAFLFCVSWVMVVVFFLYAFTDSVDTIHAYFDQGAEDHIRALRDDVYSHEYWPEVESNNVTSPGEFPSTVHYFWCGEKVFLFEHYLSLLSAVRLLKPQKIVFHYHHLPVIDAFWYNSWFQELKQSVPNLVLRFTGESPACGSRAVLAFALGLLAREKTGGIYVGERTIVTRLPPEARSSDFLAAFGRSAASSLSDVTQGVVFSKAGFPISTLDLKLENIASSSSSSSACYSVDEYNNDKDESSIARTPAERRSRFSMSKNCLVVWDSVYPKDIWNSSTPFGELSRWLFYGHRKILQVQLDPPGASPIPMICHVIWMKSNHIFKSNRFRFLHYLSILSALYVAGFCHVYVHGEVQPDPPGASPIPMICHVIWMKSNHIFKSNRFRFLHYLSILSALYVAGFRHVYVHGEAPPYGPWWDRLQGHNVTFIQIEQPETVFQQSVVGPSHQSDVLRVNILLRHGGAYQDRDVIWTSAVPDWLRRYQAVACNDWPRNGAWPEVFNMGVMMAKPGAAWLKHFLRTFSYYRDDKWAFNAVMMPYKAYEYHPDTLYVDKRLQVICFHGICHPAWHEDYIRDIGDQTPVTSFDWREARAFHFTVPKPPDSLVSPEAIRRGNDVFAEIGRMVLAKAGQLDLLE